MNSSQLKILACLTMLIDHIGAVLFPKIIILRIIGRIAFPIFAYLIAEGYRKTSDLIKYMASLMLFALISQTSFNAALVPKSLYLNVLFTFSMALFAIYMYEKEHNMNWVIFCALACELAHTDYGAFGVAVVFIFHIYHDNFKEMAKKFILITAIVEVASVLEVFISYPNNFIEKILSSNSLLELFAILSLVFIKIYNGERGNLKLKYFFYAFYPVHLGILALLKNIMP